MISEQLILATSSKLFGERTLAGSALKLAEEVGEVCGAVNKLPEGRATHEELDAELGDALIVLSQLAALRGKTLYELLADRWEEILRRNGLIQNDQLGHWEQKCTHCGKGRDWHTVRYDQCLLPDGTTHPTNTFAA